MAQMNPFEELESLHIRGRRTKRRHSQMVIDIAPEDARSANPSATLIPPAQRIPMRILLSVVILILIALGTRVLVLQLFSGESLRVTAEGNRIETQRIAAPRGDIRTHDDVVVTNNTALFEIRVNPTLVTEVNKDALANTIATVTNEPIENVRAAMQEAKLSRASTVVKGEIPYADALGYITRFQDQPAITVTQTYERVYPYGLLLGHVLGYTSKMTAEEYTVFRTKNYALDAVIGKAGVEKTYEEQVRGREGIRKMEVDVKGNPRRIIASSEPVAGNGLRLSIDFRLQSLLYEAIAAEVDKLGLPGASAVAIDPRDGSVRAMVTYPSYDNNAFTGGISVEEYRVLLNDERKPLLNRTLSGEYASGSTFKPVVAAAALEEKVITKDTRVASTGGLKVDKYIFPDWKAGGHGSTDVIKAIAESVNTFFYLAGGGDNSTSTGLGVERIASYARKFGYASRTGIDLPGERPGFLPSKSWKEEFKNEPWYLGDTYHLAIGQGDIIATPLQVAVMTATIANHGTFYQPRVVEGFIDPATQVESRIEPVVRNEQVVSRESIDIVREGMRSTVTSGSARSLSTALPVTSAGKTGTAQVGTKGKTHSWFTVFAPYEEPTIALAIVFEEGGGSNDVAVPVAREVLKTYFTPTQTQPIE